MYFIIYSFCYLFSLLPWRIMYLLSDIVAFILQRVVKYRVEVVKQNLAIAFPNKTLLERNKIANDFYRQFTDSFIETFKLLSMSDKTFMKRFSSNSEVLNDLYKTGQNVQIMAGHFFNWEFANWGVAKYGDYPFIAVYMPLSNPHFNKIILGLRKRYGSIMIPATNFRAQFQKFAT